MFMNINNFLKVQDGRLIEPTLILVGNEFDIIDGEVVLLEITDVMMFIIFLKGEIFIL